MCLHLGRNSDDGGPNQALQIHLKSAASEDVISWPLHAGDLHAAFWAAWLESSTFQFLLM